MRRATRLRYLMLLTTGVVLGGATCNDKTTDGETGGGGGEVGGGDGPRTNPDLGGGGGEAEGLALKTALGPDGQPLPSGLIFKLSEGVPDGGKKALPPPTAAKRLPDGEANALLGRLPPIDAEATDKQDFALRPGSKPPPLTGETILEAFPPPTKPDGVAPDVAKGPPTVLRYQPEGDVPLAPRITITFSNPMVPVTSHGMLAKEEVPVALTPTIEGNWRWVGTKTLFFDPVGRAPMATVYTAEVKAGTKDAHGQPLAEAKKWTFRTPPPQLLSSVPGGDSVELEPTLYAYFDQKIDPKAVLAAVKVTAGSKAAKVRELTKEEYDKLPKDWRENPDNVGRWVAFRLTEKLAPDTNVNVVFPKGLPSAEGPRTTEADQSFSFKTYGPFTLTEARCGWGDECRPGMPFQLTFSNPIDEDTMDEKMIVVEPPIVGLAAEVYGQTLNLRGMTKGKTSYKVTISKTLKDIYGQTLGKDEQRTFNVGPSQKMLMSTVGPMIVLDPMAKKRRLPVYVMNYEKLEVALYKVDPNKHWAAYNKFIQERWRDDGPKTPPGERVFSKTIETGMTPEELSEVAIDLTPALDGDFGQLIAVVKPVGADKTWERDRTTIISWVQVTQIGLDAFVDQQQLVGWATALVDGKPLSGLQLVLEPTGEKLTTDGAGLASVKLPTSAGRQMLVATSGQDRAFVPDTDYSWADAGQWVKQTPMTQMRWMVFDDRHLYRPSETINIKGIIRLHEPGAKGDVAALSAGALTRVSYTIVESRGNEMGKGTVDVSPNGTFKLAFKLPDTPNLGQAHVRFDSGLGQYSGSEYHHYFDIQEFRRPEFEVSATASEGPHLVGGKATVSITASYFAGGPLPNAEVTWNVNSSRGYFTPPNHGEFTFGTWVPWWGGWRGDEEWGPRGNANAYQAFSGRTDASGTHVLGLAFESVTPPQPTSVNAEATVQDVNRQTWSSAATLLVHPARYYVGMKTERYFVEAGKPIEVDAVVADIDGKRIEGTPIELTMVRLDWKKVKKKGWQEVEADPETCKVTSGKDPVKCKFMPKQGGQHRITAKIADPEKRPNESQITVWVPGGKTPTDRDLKIETVQIIPSKKEYEPGETAELMLQAPFFPASGVYSIRRGDMVENVPLTFDSASQTVKIKIEEWMIPGVSFAVSLNGSAVRPNEDGTPNENLPRRPAYAAGQLDISVPATLRRLTIDATPAAARVAPGEETSVTVTVKDAAGKLVPGAEVALVVVDESVLALAGYSMPDPIGIFYTGRGDHTRVERSRSRLVLAALKELFAQADRDHDGMADMTDKLAEAEEATGGAAKATLRAEMAPGAMPPPSPSAMPMEAMADSGAGANTGGPIAVRKNFDALAVFAPELPTDDKGQATVKVKMPDNLTRYRVMAVALSGPKHFGSGESTITARLPLMVRMSPPRFLNFGDTFELPIVLQNQTDKAFEVKVAVRATNATVDQGAGRSVTVPANDRVEVRFPMSAQMAGTARFQAGAVTGAWADAAEVKLPVWTPATSEAFATYGEVDKGGVVQPVQMPGEVWTQFGGVQVQTSSTQLQALTDAVLYLTKYPFECSEQIASRLMAIAALKDVLGAFKTPELPKPEVLIASVADDLKKLQGMQAYDGGFAFWRRDQETWPFLTVHVTHALLRAKEKGFTVPQHMIDQALGYLRDIRSHMTQDWYSEEVRRAIESYALYTRNRAGDRDAARAKKLIAEGGGLDKVDMEMVAWLYPVLSGAKGFEADVEAIRKHLNNRVSETAGAAHFVTSYGDGAYLLLHSDRRVDGLLLEGLIGDQPKSDLIPKLVRGLLGHKKKGRWESTQENAWVLLGLDRYFNVFEKEEPNFTVRAWLGDNYAGDHKFKGRTTERHEIVIAMAKLAELGGGKQDLTITKDGPGRLYYRVGMTYAPKSLKLDPSEHGFHVERLYEGADDPKDVVKNADGTWTVKAGARVRVKLTLHTEDRRYHVALVDPMPAGFEALNPELKGTQAAPPRNDDQHGGAWDTGTLGRPRYSWWWGPWYEHENLRDERAEAFTSLLWEGVYTYTYYTRATTPGNFVVPPPKAEEMYSPETFGRGATDRVIVQ